MLNEFRLPQDSQKPRMTPSAQSPWNWAGGLNSAWNHCLTPPKQTTWSKMASLNTDGISHASECIKMNANSLIQTRLEPASCQIYLWQPKNLKTSSRNKWYNAQNSTENQIYMLSMGKTIQELQVSPIIEGERVFAVSISLYILIPPSSGRTMNPWSACRNWWLIARTVQTMSWKLENPCWQLSIQGRVTSVMTPTSSTVSPK